MAGDLFTGTLELLILQVLHQEAMHGYRIAQWIKDRSEGVLEVEQGALYPALHRLNRKGLIAGDWGETDQGRRARFYRLTAKGRRVLEAEQVRWARHARAVNAVLTQVES
jgi:transcriptional regulator